MTFIGLMVIRDARIVWSPDHTVYKLVIDGLGRMNWLFENVGVKAADDKLSGMVTSKIL